MKRPLCLSAMLLLTSAAGAAAEPIVFGTASLTTSGVFSCRAQPECTASGNTVVLGTGGDAVTLTFTGVETSVPISNTATPVSLGTLSASSTSATFPTRTNPLLPIVGFNLTLTHSAPVPDSDWLFMLFGPGGGTTLPFLMGYTLFTMNPGPSPEGMSYPTLVYSLSPFVFSVPMNGSVDVTADVGAVPEPGTLALAAFGLAGLVRKRLRARG